MNWLRKNINWGIIIATCVSGGIVIFARSVDPWWIFLTCNFVVIVSRFEILLLRGIIDKKE